MQTAFWFYVSPLAIHTCICTYAFEKVVWKCVVLDLRLMISKSEREKTIVQIIFGRSLMHLHLPTKYINHSNFHGNTNAHVLCYQTHLNSIWECNWSWSHLFADKELFQSIDKRCIFFRCDCCYCCCCCCWWYCCCDFVIRPSFIDARH